MDTHQQEEARDEILQPDHHHRLNDRLAELRNLARCDDPRRLAECWSRFEHELEEHLFAEEEYILPAFALEYPLEALGVRSEHGEIRRLVGALGVSVELHQVRAEELEQLAAKLADHARREDEVVYPWATHQLIGPRDVARRLVGELRLQVHLAGMDVRDRFESLQREWHHLERQALQAPLHRWQTLVAGLDEVIRWMRGAGD